MIIQYFNIPELSYCGRKRYRVFSFEPFSEEEQLSVKLGDGATTSIKTSILNICNYVKIDNTRWFVMSYIYLNGGQVRLNLQRDVVGEFGLSDCFGKIERGYTNTILKNRKELSLNQVLKKRVPIIPNTLKYNNFSVSTHEKEAWGILYLVKPTELDPSTGKPYPEQVTVNIPAFRPIISENSFIENNTKYNVSQIGSTYINFTFDFVNQSGKNLGSFFECYMKINVGGLLGYYFSYELNQSFSTYDSIKTVGFRATLNTSSTTSSYLRNLAENICEMIGDALVTGTGISLPELKTMDENIPSGYDGITILKDNKYYRYSVSETKSYIYGTGTTESVRSAITSILQGKTIINTNVNVTNISSVSNTEVPILVNVYNTINQLVFNYTELVGEEKGDFTIDLSEQLIDEPFSVMVFPLFDCKIISEVDNTEYNISKDYAFMIFNSVIQFLSGENSYIVDAQIYPYCPMLDKVSTSINGYPFFSIVSTSYYHNCELQLLPFSDVKKEYIEREYSIVSPDKSNKFTFSYYDYKTEIIDNNGINSAKLNLVIKTALKPFSIISSVVILRDDNSLKGLYYETDLNGSQPTSNGFECSLSSNLFEQYKRQNSNYQQLFSIDQQELQRNHYNEMVNDTVSTIVNTLSASAMGALAGKAMTDAGLLGKIFGTGAGGAIAGGAIAGGTTAGIMAWQDVENAKTRELEESFQKQRFDLNIGTVKNLPNSINRISSFNEIILKEFYFVMETYECTEAEKIIVDNFINKYGYGIGVFDFLINYQKNGWFLRSTLVSSSYEPNLHLIAEKEFMGGIYLYEQN